MGLDTAECQDEDGHMGLAGDILYDMIEERKNAGYVSSLSLRHSLQGVAVTTLISDCHYVS